MSTIDLDGNDLLAAVQAQRNEAMDTAANNAAAIQALQRRILQLEKQIADSDKPKEENAG